MTDAEKLKALRMFAGNIVEMIDDPVPGDTEALIQIFDILYETEVLAGVPE